MCISNLSDQELVQLYVNGDEQGLVTLLNRHQSKIFRSILMVVRDRSVADDVFQETFFKVIQTLKRGQYNEEGKFLPWVIRISRNLVIDHFRRIKKMPPMPVFVNSDGEESNVLFDLADEDSGHNDNPGLKKEVRSVINELPQDQREVVIMRTYYDLSFKEIAEITGVSINTALGRMRYALFNMKKIIEEKNLELMPR